MAPITNKKSKNNLLQLPTGSTSGYKIRARKLQAGEEEPGPPQAAHWEEWIVGFEGETPQSEVAGEEGGQSGSFQRNHGWF